MADVQRRNFQAPDEHVEYPLGYTDEVHLGELVVGRSRHRPGWRWSDHIKPIVGTPSCQNHHVGIVVSGRLGIRTDDGREFVFGPDDVYDIPPGHDGWVVGDEAVDLVEWVGVHQWATAPSGERVLATVVFTDIVDSTATAQRLGDVPWRRLLEEHDTTIRTLLDRYRGQEVATTGDGFLALFDGAERALRAALGMAAACDDIGVPIRVGIHTGEVEVVPGNIRGVTVHVAARVMALAGPGEVLVSSTTRDLVESRELAFDDRGTHELKGVTGARPLFLVTHAPSTR